MPRDLLSLRHCFFLCRATRWCRQHVLSFPPFFPPPPLCVVGDGVSACMHSCLSMPCCALVAPPWRAAPPLFLLQASGFRLQASRFVHVCVCVCVCVCVRAGCVDNTAALSLLPLPFIHTMLLRMTLRWLLSPLTHRSAWFLRVVFVRRRACFSGNHIDNDAPRARAPARRGASLTCSLTFG
jgi:hypothetical protein